MKLQSRLLLINTATVTMALSLVLIISSIFSENALEEMAKDKLTAIQVGRTHALTQFLNDMKAKLNVLATAPNTSLSIGELTDAFAGLGEQAQSKLQQRYLSGNRYSREDRSNFEVLLDPDAYDKIHSKHAPRYRVYQTQYHWDDVMLIDSKGNVVFSLYKEKDFATNLVSGPWKNTGLAKAVMPLLKNPVPGTMGFADFERYAPSNGQASAFIAMPVFNSETSQFMGVAATQIDASSLNDMMHDTTGLGDTGESFLVGHDRWMLTNSRFVSESTALRKQLDTEPVKKALRGESGFLKAHDYRGVGSLAVVSPFYPFEGSLGEQKVMWGMIVKTDQDEALQGVTTLQHVLFLLGIFCAILSSLLAAWGARAVSKPIIAIQEALTKLANREDTAVPFSDRKDEIGSMAQAAESFRVMAQQIERSHWMNSHLAGLTSLVSNQTLMKEVPDLILDYLCKCLEIAVAALYFIDDKQQYARVGIHGLARRNQVDDHFSLGTGLVGQCARDQQAIVMSPVPEGLSVISAGLAEFSPKELIFYPIQHKENVLGVLELATTTILTPYQHEFLAAVGKGLGLHLANLKAAEHNVFLLAETRKQTVILNEQRAQVEEASRYSRSLLEACLDALVTISVEGQITDVNTATEKITGVSREKLIGSDFTQYFTDPKQAEAGYRKVFAEGKVVDYPLTLRHISGKIIDVLYNASVYSDANGKVMGVFAAARDVTELKKQQEQVAEASRYSRSLLEACLDALVTISIEGQITDVNTATEKITGVNREYLIGSNFNQYFTDPDQAEKGYRKVFAEGKVVDYPLAIRHVSGKIIDVLYNASIYSDATGKVAGVFAAARDVTELKQQQEILRNSNEEMKSLTEELKTQNEEFRANQEEMRIQQEEMQAQQEEMRLKNKLLEEQGKDLTKARQEAEAKAQDLGRANRYKSDFLANMSHELRTPLNSILILAKNLSENDEKNLSADQTESAMVIHESGCHLLTLINDILDLSKIESGHFELYNEHFPLNEIMLYLRRAFVPLVEKKGIRYESEVDSNVPEIIQGDRQRIIQILTNLLSNAVKFTDNGYIKIHVKNLGDNLRFEVTDTGIGIPEEKYDIIFGEFQQADSGTSRKYGGSGLGLAISKRLIELMGGSIHLSSKLSQGSVFSVQIPLIAATSIPAPSTKSSMSNAMIADANLPTTKNTTPVLMVEDDSRLVTILSRLLDSMGFAVTTVDSGEKALEKIRLAPPAGILLDLGLPGMNGIEVLQKLKANPKTKNIPVFIMSASNDTGEAKTLGALGFLKKPVTKETIGAAIRTMLAQQAAIAKSPCTLLVVEDNPTEFIGLKLLFKDDPIQLVQASTGKEGLQWLIQNTADAIILDLMLPDISGFDWLKQLTETYPTPPPVIVYSARELTGDELFQLRAFVEVIVTKGKNNERLREEVLQILEAKKPVPVVNSEPSIDNLLSKELLLVDDDVRNLFALSKVLRQKGFHVEIAPSGMKALEALEKQKFDIVLSDIMMPEMDGYTLIRKIRELGYDKLPIIAVTAKAMLGDVDLCLQAGANDYIPKPVDVNYLLEVMKRWL